MDYYRVSLNAKQSLAENGRNCTLSQITTGAYDYATGSATQTVSDITVKAADFAVKGEISVNGTLIAAGDRYAIISGVDVATVSLSDRLTIDGVIWNIIAVVKIAPAGVPVIHKVYVRK